MMPDATAGTHAQPPAQPPAATRSPAVPPIAPAGPIAGGSGGGGGGGGGGGSGGGRVRLAGLAVALGGVGPLAVGAWLTPAGAGHGTHTQLGLPSCGWVAAFGRPCPTCGMTTSVTHAAHGDLLSAAAAQPAGASLALLAAIAFWAGLHQALTGAGTLGAAAGLLRARAAWLAGGIVLAAWLYKIVTF